MKRFLLTAVGACLLVLASAMTAAAQTGTITGTVTDAVTAQPVPGARVDALHANGATAATAFTNSDGRYRISVAAGTYALSVVSVGYTVAQVEGVSVTASGSASRDVALETRAFELNEVVISVGRGTVQKATDAPALVSVATSQEIRAKPALTPVDYIRTMPGVDVITQGVQSTNVSVRGFNNIFSGSLHVLTDHRLSSVPSLRVNVIHFVPTTNDDLERIEVVLGPGSALYGPNTASGVMHMITRSPLAEQTTSLNVTGGTRDVLQGSGRTAFRVSDDVGLKFSGSYLQATEWIYNDPDEIAEQQKFVSADSMFFRQDLERAVGVDEAHRRIDLLLLGRDNDVERWSGEGRLDWRATPDLTAVLQSGMTNVGSGVELTGLGAAQAKDWRYTYYQARADWNRLFAQVYYNQSDAGDTYLLRTGQPIVDESTLLVAQLQHGTTLMGGRQNFTYGFDYFNTNPQTQGTINGDYEDDDETTEIGGYLQSETALTPRLNLVLAGRFDDHSALPDPIFSPRAGIVFKPADEQAFRVTYNRAFSTPTSLNQFLDLSTSIPDQTINPLNAGAARLGFSVRVQGTGTEGFSFQQSGSYMMRSPFTPGGLGGPTQLLPADVSPFFPAAVQAAAALGVPLSPADLQFLASLQPTAADISTNFVSGGTSIPIAQLVLPDIAPIHETTTSTFEVGYNGVLAERLSLSGGAWFSKIEDFVTPLTLSTPFLTLNPEQLGAYIVPRLMQRGVSQQLALQMVAAMAQVPLGVISSADVNASGAQVLATYTNVDESLDVWGVDLSAQYLLTPSWSLSGTASFASDDVFTSQQVGTVTLNAPTLKGSLGLEYRPTDGPFSGEVRMRHNNEFPVQSGVFEATRCIDDDTTAAPCVQSYTLFDVNLGYQLPQVPGAALQLNVSNVFDEPYRSFPGTPEIGAMVLLRLRYEFGGSR